MTTAVTRSDFQERCAQARCRLCNARGLMGVLDLGQMPLADGLRTPAQLGRPEERYPLEVAFCPACSLVQIIKTVPPERVFGSDYPYYSSFSPALLEHSRANALALAKSRRLNADSFVLEIASNDGYLLKNFVELGIPVLGVDPAPGPAEQARARGVPTLCEFFGSDLARRLAEEGKYADVVVANNVLAHVADTNGLVEGVRMVLKDDGVAVIEAPYVCELIRHGEFDTIYHEHLCYFSVTALDRLFRRNGLFLNDVEPLPIHGGSLRLYVERRPRVRPGVIAMLEAEQAAGVDGFAYYRDFSERVQRMGRMLRKLLTTLKRRGKRIAAYGAAAKGAVMLNYVGAGPELIDFVVDRNVHKHGKIMPGVDLPICDVSRLVEDMPDYTLLLTWNFRDEILAQQSEYRARGGRFIVPIPRTQIV